jgi:hypothetical protein
MFAAVFLFVLFIFCYFLIVFCYIFVPYLYRHLKGDKVALMSTYGTLKGDKDDKKNK